MRGTAVLCSLGTAATCVTWWRRLYVWESAAVDQCNSAAQEVLAEGVIAIDAVKTLMSQLASNYTPSSL